MEEGREWKKEKKKSDLLGRWTLPNLLAENPGQLPASPRDARGAVIYLSDPAGIPGTDLLLQNNLSIPLLSTSWDSILILNISAGSILSILRCR